MLYEVITEFRIDGEKLVQSAYFLPKGLWGRLYWYMLVPLHALVFGDMIRSVMQRAQIESARAS